MRYIAFEFRVQSFGIANLPAVEMIKQDQLNSALERASRD